MIFPAHKTINVASIVVIVALTAAHVPAATFRVDPNDPNAFSSIQEAIDAAWDFDTIVVNPGSYREHINFFGKAILVTGSDPNDPNVVAATIINGDGEGKVAAFINDETELSILDGFTITGGNVGIYCEKSATEPVIRRCVIRDNSAGIDGSPFAKPTIIECIIKGNSNVGISNCGGEIKQCLIAENDADGLANHWGTLGACRRISTPGISRIDRM